MLDPVYQFQMMEANVFSRILKSLADLGLFRPGSRIAGGEAGVEARCEIPSVISNSTACSR
jgi:hypothetical protein